MVCLIELFVPSMHWTQPPTPQRRRTSKSFLFITLAFQIEQRNTSSSVLHGIGCGPPPTMNHFSLLMSISAAAQVPTCTYKLPSEQEGFQGLAGKLVKARAWAKNKHPKRDEELGECAEHSLSEQGENGSLCPAWLLGLVWALGDNFQIKLKRFGELFGTECQLQ